MMVTRFRVLIVLLTCVGLLTSCSGGNKASLPENDKKAEKKMPPQAEQKTTKDANLEKNAPQKKEAKNSGEEKMHRLVGDVTSSDRIYLSFRVPGNIDDISAKPGEKVKKGQVLAKLYDGNYLLSYEAAKLDLEAAENSLLLAERDFNIEKELREKDISSPVQFQDRELLYKKAVINKKIAHGKMLTAKTSYDDTRLIAPADGVVARQFKFVGDQSTGGAEGGATFEMFTFKDPEIYLRAPEALLSRLKAGEELEVNFPSIRLKLPAKVKRTVPAVSEKDRTFLVVVGLLKKDPQVVPGLFAEGLVKESQK